MDHLHLTFVDYLSPQLSTRPIRHLLWLSVSCGTQGSTVQKSFPHKCGQKNSCSAFNAVVVAFPWIFLGFFLSRMFMRHVLINGVSWKVILVAGIDTWDAFIISKEGFSLGPPSIRSLLMRLWIGTSNNYLFLLGPFNVLGQGQNPIYDFEPLSLH